MQLQAYLAMQTKELEKLVVQYNLGKIKFLHYKLFVDEIVSKMIRAIAEYEGEHASL